METFGIDMCKFQLYNTACDTGTQARPPHLKASPKKTIEFDIDKAFFELKERNCQNVRCKWAQPDFHDYWMSLGFQYNDEKEMIESDLTPHGATGRIEDILAVVLGFYAFLSKGREAKEWDRRRRVRLSAVATCTHFSF